MIKDLVESNQTDNKKKEQFDREILVALNEYFDYRGKKSNNEEGKGLRKTL